MSDIIIVDIEASGLHFDSYPIEIALRICHKTYTWLIKPENDWHYWSKEAEYLHGISLNYLSNHGISVYKVANKINSCLSKTTGIIYSDAAEWDNDWMKILFHAAGISPCFTILPIQDLMNITQRDTFTDKIHQLAKSGNYRKHRAGEDVEMIENAYQFVMDFEKDD
jgi:hypothetical protein